MLLMQTEKTLPKQLLATDSKTLNTSLLLLQCRRNHRCILLPAMVLFHFSLSNLVHGKSCTSTTLISGKRKSHTDTNQEPRRVPQRRGLLQDDATRTTVSTASTKSSSAVVNNYNSTTKQPQPQKPYDWMDDFQSHLSTNPRVADLQEGFIFALIAFLVIGCMYQLCCKCCCCSNSSASGICLVDRIERKRRRERIVQDGRGVFAPVIGDDEEFAEYGEDSSTTMTNGNGRRIRQQHQQQQQQQQGHRLTLANEYGDPEDWDPDNEDNILEASAHEYFHDEDDDENDNIARHHNHANNGGVELTMVRGK